jgi:hypothetical protein
VRDVVLAALGGHFLLPVDELVDLARAHVDAREYVALAQHLHREFLAQAVAVAGVVDALRGQRLGQPRQRDAVLLGEIPQRVVQHFIRHLDARAVGALHLQFLQHQALEHLLAEHVLRRQIELLLTQAIREHHHLFVDFAGEHHAFVDGGGHAVEQLAGARCLTRLGDDDGRGEGAGKGG